MGLVHVPVTLRDVGNRRKKYLANFLVDTGATDCMAPAAKLKRAGIRARGCKTYELADGTRVNYEFGYAEIELMG